MKIVLIILLAIYTVSAFLLSLSMLLLNYFSLKKMTSTKVAIMFSLSPILFLREFFKKNIKEK